MSQTSRSYGLLQKALGLLLRKERYRRWCEMLGMSVPERGVERVRSHADVHRHSLETLEPRLLMHGDPLATVFARLDGVIPSSGAPGAAAMIDINITDREFATSRGSVVLGFEVHPAGGSQIDPAAVIIRDAGGAVVAPYSAQHDLPGSIDSYTLIELPMGGSYTIEVADQNGSTGGSGGFVVDVHLIGDLDGNRTVDVNDRNALTALIRDRQYLPEADANRDGLLLSLDTSMLLRNVGSDALVTPLDLGVSLDPGAQVVISGEPFTNIAGQIVEGVTSPGAVVMLDVDNDGVFDASVTASGDGAFDFPVTLAEGGNTLVIQAGDSFGQIRVATLAISLDTTPPAVGVPDLIDASDTGASQADNITRDNTPTFSVTADPGSIVKLFVDGDETATQVADASGQALFTITTPLADGDHLISVSASDPLGNTGASSALSITIDTIAPALSLFLFAGSDTDPIGDNITTLPAVTLIGTAEDGLDVLLFAAGDLTQPIATTTANGGAFAFDDVALALGLSAFIVRSTDGAGNTGEASLDITRQEEDEDPAPATLREEANFHVAFSTTFTVPDSPSTLAVTFADLQFDADDDFIRDAFEIALVDGAGRSLVHTIGGGLLDAAFNLTEGEPPLLGVNTQLAGQTVLIDLMHIAAGTQATLIARLINNDADTTTSVRIESVQVLDDGGLGTPNGAPAAPLALVADASTIDFASLSDVTPSLLPRFRTTTFGESADNLQVKLSFVNAGSFLIDAPIIAVVKSLSDPSVSVRNAHGMTPDGLPYFIIGANATGTLLPGDESVIGSLSFANPQRVQFTYDLLILGRVNRAPSIISEPITEARAGVAYRYDINAIDLDGDDLTFALLASPAGMTIDAATGLIQFQPAAGDVGRQDVRVLVSDGRGGGSEQAFTLLVRESIPNRPPALLAAPPVEARVGTLYTYDVDAFDVDGDALTFALIDAPAGMAIDAVTGVITWTPAADDLGEHAVQLTVSDGQDGATQSFAIVVLPAAGNSAPIIITTPTVTFNLPGIPTAPLGDVDPIAIDLNLSPGELVVRTISITLPDDADDAGFADIIITVDESGSMAGEHAFIAEMVLQLNAALEARGIGPNRFALAGFTSSVRIFNIDQNIEATNVRIDVFGPDGSLVDTINVVDPDTRFFRDVTFNTMLPVDGEYTFIVRALNAANLTFDRDITTANDTPVTVSGLDVVHTGTLAQGQSQVFDLSLNAGMMIYIDELGGGSQARVTLAGPTGDALLNAEVLSSDRRFIRIPRSGGYTLSVSNPTASAQSFNFRVLDADAALLADDTPTGGTLAPLEAALFAFEGVAGDIIRLDNLGPAGAQWGLFSPAGTRLINDLSGFQNITAAIEVTLGGTGTHYVAVINGSATLTRDFSFTMHKAETPVTAINLGETFSGTIAAPGDQAYFSFQGTAGQRVYYDGFEGIVPTLLAPDGSSAGIAANNPIDFREPVTLAQTGTYLLAFNPVGGATGAFTGRLLDVADAAPLQLDADTLGTFAIGRETTLFTFDGTAGLRLFLNSATGATGEFDLFDANNNLIAGNTLSQGAGNIVLPQDGAYVLAIQGTGAAGNGFNFRLSTPETHIVPLTLGEEIHGAVSEAGERFHFTFEGVAGQVVYYDGGLSGVNHSNLDARIVTPGGQTFASSVTAAAFNDISPIVLTETGTYYVLINGEGSFTGGFGFRLLDSAAAPVLNLAGNSSGTLANGRATQLFRFEGVAGQRLNFDSLSSSGTGRLKIYEPDGSQHEDRALSADFTTVLPSTGTYILAIEGQSATPVSFNFDVSDITAAPIANTGFDTPISGTIAAGASQVFHFDASAGTFVMYDALLNGMPATLRVTLTSPGGANIINNIAASTLRNALDLLPESGVYTLTLSSTAATEQPFAFQLIDAGAATPLVFDTPTAGSIAPGLGMKLFRFTASAGERITFVSSAAGSGTWGITGIDGSQVMTFSSLTNDRVLDVPADGAYTLILRGDSAAGPVAFDFTALSNERTTTPVTVGSVISGALSEPGERDYYTVDLIAGQTIYFDGLTSDDVFGIDKRILDPLGQQVASNNATDDVMLRVETTGTYRIEIFGQSVGVVGAYSFELEDVSIAAAMPLDVVQSIALSNGLDTQLFSFTAAAGDRLFFDTTASSGPATGTLRLWGPDVREVDSRNFGTDFETVINTAGTYIVQVQGRNANGAASISFNIITPQTVTTTLNLGDIIIGSISEIGEQDVFTFTGTKGQELYLDGLGGTANFSFDIFTELNRSVFSGNLISSGSDAGLFALPMDGTYRIVIDGAGATTGDYSFRLIDADAAPIITDLLAGAIHSNIAAEVFRVQGSAGDVVTFERNRDFRAFGTAQEVSDLTSVLQVGFVGTEDGYAAMASSLALASEFRPGAARNIILITDEDRDNTDSSLTFVSMLELLEANNVLLNVIVDGNFADSLGNVAIGMDSDGRSFVADGSGGFIIDPAGVATGGFGATLADYIHLAFANGGGAFDLKQLRAGGDPALSFAHVFIEIKAEEILQQLGRLDVIASDPSVIIENLTGELNGIGADDSASFDIRFTGDGINRAFDLLFIRPQSGVIVGSIPVTFNNDYTYHAAALDPDGDDITFALAAGPAGATIDPTTGLLTFEPSVAGVFDFIIEARDTQGGVTTQAFTLNVTLGRPNNAPIITSPPPAQAVIGQPLAHQVIADDADGDALSYFLLQASQGMAIDPITGLLTWTAAGNQLGANDVELLVIDGQGGQAVLNFSIEVVADADNHAPIFITAPPGEALPDELFTYHAQAADADADPLTYDLALAPQGMAVDGATGRIVWTPAADQTGIHQIILRVRDGRGGHALQVFDLAVAGDNSAPIITSPPPTVAVVDQPWQYQPAAQDAEGDAISFRLDAAPPGMFIDGTTGLITFTPALAQVGDQQVILVARDARGAESSQTFTLSIFEANDNLAPVITSLPRDHVALGRTYLYRVVAEDADGDQILFSLDQAPLGMTISSDGLITWNPAPSQFGDNAVTVRISDGRGGIAVQSFTIDVRSQAINTPPVITSTAPVSAIVGQPFGYDLTATDAENDPVIFLLAQSPAGMSIEPLTGRLRWNPKLGQLGQTTVIVEAIDGQGAATSQTFTLTISALNSPPSIVSIPPTQAAIGQNYVYDVNAIDGNGDVLTYALSQSPAGMIIDPITGLITWTPQAGQEGLQSVTVFVSDGAGGQAVQQFKIGVQAAAINDPPVITTTPIFVAQAGGDYAYDVNAIDPDGDDLSFALDLFPQGMTIDPQTGLIQWQPAAGQAGPHQVRVIVSDGAGNAALQGFHVTVLVQNAGPSINSAPPGNVAAVGLPYRYDVLASDPDGDALAFSLVQGPAGMTIDSLGRLRWTPGADQVAGHEVIIRVTDPLGSFASQSFTLTAIVDSTAPLVRIDLSENPVDPGTPVEVFIRATDQVGVVALDATFNGIPLALDAAGRAVVTPQTVGQFDIIATARDASGNVTVKTVTLNVTDTSDVEAPFVFIRSPQPGETITSFLDVIGSVQDDNLASYTLSIAPLDGNSFTTIATGNANVDDALLGLFDPTLLQNGPYRLRLTAIDLGGLVSGDEIIVDVAGDLKLGNFTMTFVDLSIPLSGIPIEVARTYDSLDANQRGDFGFGWRLEFAQANLRTTLPTKGQQGDFIFEGFKPGTRVYVTLPGGKREGFTFQAAPDGILGGFLGIFIPTFVPDEGNTSTLTVQSEKLRFNPDLGEFQSYVGLLPYNPASPAFGGAYTLTTKEGLEYTIDGISGDVRTIADRNGVTLTFEESGISSSVGARVDFERDAQGRITAVIDPEGNRIEYAYDAAGDLVAVTDRRGNETQLRYGAARPHFLEEVIDPLGRTGVRSEYDADGRVVRLIDAGGEVFQFTYDPQNSIRTTTDRLNQTTTLEYDARGNVVTLIYPDGGIVRQSFDANDHLTSFTDALNRTTTLVNDARGNVLSVTDPLGHVSTSTYNRFNQLLTHTDALGNTTTYTYDALGNMLSKIDALSFTTTYSYDAAGNVTTLTDALGHVTRFDYDSRGNLIRTADALGHATTYTYDGNGNLLTSTSALTTPGGVRTLTTTMTYDNEGRLLTERDAEGHLTTHEYDAAGNRTATIDGLGRRFEFQYNDENRVIARLFDGIALSAIGYDAEGSLTEVTDPLGRVTRFTYDPLGRLTGTIYPDGTPDDTDNPRTAIEWNLAGQQTAFVDENGNRTEWDHDARGLRSVVRDALGYETTFTHDVVGNLILQIDPFGQSTTFVYDATGRLIQTVFADGTTMTTTYDAMGRRVAETDQAGRTTRYEYDAAGNLTAVVDPALQRAEFEYDEAGNLVLQRDVNGHQTRLEYDGLGRQIALVRPLGQRSAMTYDAVGNLISLTDFNGDTTTFEYDFADRLIAEHFPDLTATLLAYTAAGALESVTDARGVTLYEYDERDRLVRRTDPDGRSIAYTYDGAGNILTRTVPSGTVIHTYTPLNRIDTVTDPDGGVTRYIYDEVGNIVRTERPNNTVEVRQYDALYRLIGIETRNGGGELLTSFQYTLGADGVREAVVELDGRQVGYSYDVLNRLTQETIADPINGSRAITYTYDAGGNRLSRDDSVGGLTTYIYDDNDRLLEETTAGIVTTYQYDDNGNTLSKLTDADHHTTYIWDAKNQLVAVQVIEDGISTEATYEYDVDGIRVTETIDGIETRFMIDATPGFAQVIEEVAPDDSITAFYVHGNDLISQIRSGVQSFFETDGVGSTRALVDGLGVTSDTYHYDAYGRLLQRTGVTENNHLYTGERQDRTTGLTYLRARYLDTSIGRFISTDPFSGVLNQPTSLHRYLYAGASPVNAIDPTGLFDFSLIVTTISTAITAFDFGMLAGTAASAVIKVNRGFNLIRVGRATKDIAYEMIGLNTGAGIEMYMIGEFIMQKGGKEIGDAGGLVSQIINEALKGAFKAGTKALTSLTSQGVQLGVKRLLFLNEVKSYIKDVEDFISDPDKDKSVSITRKAIKLVLKANKGL